MREKEFTRFVRDLQDQEARKPKANRQTIEAIIQDIADKQTRMETENEWNIMSPEDSMIMALAGYIESTKSQTNNKAKKKTQGSEQSTKKSNDTSDTKPKSKEDRFPAWKKTLPNEGESKTKVVENRTYYWCTKCRAGKGLWAMHKEHDDNFVPSSKRNLDKEDSKLHVTETATKKVSLNLVPATANEDIDNGDEPQVKVKPQLLVNNAKTYLAQFQDFQTGGLQG